MLELDREGFCPFPAGPDIDAPIERWGREPDPAAQALRMEHTALALNPRSALFGKRTAYDLAVRHGLDTALALFDEFLTSTRWAVYDVRRVYPAKSGDPATKGPGWRAVSCLDTGERDEIRDRVLALPDALVDEHGIARQWLLRAGPPYPAGEHMTVAAPAGVQDKQRPGFAALWARVVQHPQLSLFDACGAVASPSPAPLEYHR